MNKKNKYKRLTILFLIISVIWFNSTMYKSTKNQTGIDLEALETLPYTEFLADAEKSEVATLYYTVNNPNVYIEKTDGSYYIVPNPEYDTFKKDMLENGLIVKSITELSQGESLSSTSVIGMLILISVSFSMGLRWLACYLEGLSQNNPEVVVGTKPNATNDKKESPDTSIHKFSDVAGLYEVKKDVRCLVDFLKNGDKYTAAGAKLPKGVIFYGPPGTGKTLLAKAIAGEAGIPFHYMSGADFVEMYVGVGAKRVRELFATAKKKTPCIIFIDEIDAIGGKRGNNDSNGEDRKTINALLTEMDGFKSSENILVIAATNRLEDLDPALVRPGRFTNKFCVPLPETVKERMEIIKLYSKNKKFCEDVDFEALAKETIGFSPASIEALLNESAIVSVQDGKRFVDKASIDKAMMKILLSGHVKENQEDRSKEELELVAWHEAGHALVGKLNGKDIPKVTILSTTSGAGGVTFTTPKQRGLYSVSDLKNEVMELYAGRVAELLLLKDKERITTGASNDIQKATSIIKDIVTSYGMSDEFGMLNLNQLGVGQSVIIEKETTLAKELEEATVKLLTENFDKLERIALGLLESETLYEHDITEIVNG